MKNRRLFFLAAFFALSAAALMGFGKKEKSEPPLFRDRNGVIPVPAEKTPEEIEQLPLVRVSGRVRMIGSGIRTEPVISGADGEWHLEAKDQEQFIRLQQKTVTVEGKLDAIEISFADNSRSIRFLILRNAKIIAPE